MSHPRALFVLNFPAGTGYAWATIEQVMLEVFARLRGSWEPLVCRPVVPAHAADPFSEAGIRVLSFDYETTSRDPRRAAVFAGLLRRERVKLLYLTDQPTWSPRYALFRLAGVRRIVIHDRTSGQRTQRFRGARQLKRAAHRLPGCSADRMIAVSDFVARRMIEIGGASRSRVARVYNGIDMRRFDAPDRHALQRLLGLPSETPVVFASGRAMPYKGIPVLIRAAGLLRATHPDAHFAYAGDGPALATFRAEAASLGLEQFHFLGRRPDTAALVASATVAAVPSVWAEAFGLTVVEAMAAGVPVVASAVGGIPELITQDQTGALVPPGDQEALARTLDELLTDAPRRARLARRAQEEARRRFSIERVADELAAVLAT